MTKQTESIDSTHPEANAGKNDTGSAMRLDGFGNLTKSILDGLRASPPILFGLGFVLGGFSIWGLHYIDRTQESARIEVSVPAPDMAPEDEEAIAVAEPPAAEEITVAALETTFDGLGYDLQQVRAQQADVPRILPAAVPHDLSDIQEVNRRKALFLRMVLPLVLMTNERLLAQRDRIKELQKQVGEGGTPSEADAAWLAEMFETYRVEPGDFKTLLIRVDVVPPSLALAQAAVESGWGTSRFAREGNALFGQWVWGDDAEGIVPEARQEGKTHKIKSFDTPLEAVAAYIKNLNRHNAYRKLRQIRAALRAQGARLNGAHLAEGLEAYSEKGMEYVKLIRGIIATNKLRPLDRARLASERVSQSA